MSEFEVLSEFGKVSTMRSKLMHLQSVTAEDTPMTSRNVVFLSKEPFCRVTKKENTCGKPELASYLGQRKIDKAFAQLAGSQWAIAKKHGKIEKIVVGKAPICVVELGLFEDGKPKAYFDYKPGVCDSILQGVKLDGVDFNKLKSEVKPKPT